MKNDVYYIDLEREHVGAVQLDSLDVYKERHYVQELGVVVPDTSLKLQEIIINGNSSVIFCLHGGLPSDREFDASLRIHKSGRQLFYYWPAECALELVTNERLHSFKRHRDMRQLFWAWRNFKKWQSDKVSGRKLKRLQKERASKVSVAVESDITQPAGHKLPFVNSTGDGRIPGRGLYFRLDYWAQLKGGGSYGHTCYQAKALKKLAEDYMCVLGSRFELLDSMGIDQIVLPPRVRLADEYTLVQNGKAYEPIVKELIRFYKPDYVFERLVLGNTSVGQACKALGVPYIAEYNGSELTMAKVFGGRAMENAENLEAAEQFSFDSADLISVISEPVKDTLLERGVSADKILVNPNGVDLDAYGPLPEVERVKLRESLGFKKDDIVVGFCATFGGWHGVEVLADALPVICQARIDAKFLLIGDGLFKHLVMDKVGEFDLQDRVHDAGMVPQQQASRLLASCDILLSPHSKSMGDQPFFGSPTKLFEYMAYGVGIVCSDLYQLGEVMRPAVFLDDVVGTGARDDVRSVLIRPGSVCDLVQATLLLLNDAELRNKLGKNVQHAARTYYTWDVHADNLWRFTSGRPLKGYHIDRGIS